MKKKERDRRYASRRRSNQTKTGLWETYHRKKNYLLTFLPVFLITHQLWELSTVSRAMTEQVTPNLLGDNGNKKGHSPIPDMNIPTTTNHEIINAEEKVIDILQIGSKIRPELMVAQQHSFASHVSIRHVFNATEEDDTDQLCNSQLTDEQSYGIGNFCRRVRWSSTTHKMMNLMRNNHAAETWLQKKKNPAGWMCAQRRPLHGLYKVLQKYRNDGIDFPDLLIIMDDDTYYNIEQLLKQYVDDTPELPLVRAGCLVRMPLNQIAFTFPFGGYGTIFNRASLRAMIKPIHCPGDSELCAQIEASHIGEQPLFQDGMAIIDLIQAYATHQPYTTYGTDKWTQGYCLHSDWAIGFFVNHYNISRHSPGVPEPPQDRIEEWLGSQIYKREEGNCKNEAQRSQCQPNSLVCHYMQEEQMMNFTKVVKAQYPDRFRKITSLS